MKSSVSMGYPGASPPPFRLGEPALCGSQLLVTHFLGVDLTTRGFYFCFVSVFIVDRDTIWFFLVFWVCQYQYNRLPAKY